MAAAAAAGGAAGAAAAVAAGRLRLPGESGPEYAESGNITGEGSYYYRAWTSGAKSWDFAYLPACLLCVASLFSL